MFALSRIGPGGGGAAELPQGFAPRPVANKSVRGPCIARSLYHILTIPPQSRRARDQERPGVLELFASGKIPWDSSAALPQKFFHELCFAAPRCLRALELQSQQAPKTRGPAAEALAFR